MNTTPTTSSMLWFEETRAWMETWNLMVESVAAAQRVVPARARMMSTAVLQPQAVHADELHRMVAEKVAVCISVFLQFQDECLSVQVALYQAWADIFGVPWGTSGGAGRLRPWSTGDWASRVSRTVHGVVTGNARRLEL